MLDQTQIKLSVDALLRARQTKVPLRELPPASALASLDDAYLIQEQFACASGWPVVGYKVGAASAASQKFIGASAPFIARLFADDCLPSPMSLPQRHFFDPGVEAEFAFRLGQDLPASRAPYSGRNVAASIEAVAPIIEVCDHRFADWKTVGLNQIIADNGFFGALVIGHWRSDWRDLNLIDLSVSIAIDDVVKGRGAVRDVLGEPLDSVALVANQLSTRGFGLRAGDIVAIGTWTGLHLLKRGSTALADFGALGTVVATT